MPSTKRYSIIFGLSIFFASAYGQDGSTSAYGDSTAVLNDTSIVVSNPEASQQQADSGSYYRINKTYLKSFFTDLPKVAAAPFHYSPKDWQTVGLVTATVGVTLLADREIKQVMQRNKKPWLDKSASIVEPFGNKYAPLITGALYVTGVVTKDRKMEHASLMTAKSLAFSTLFYISSKQLVRRRRPSFTDDPFEINSVFGGGREWTSFPSGHTNTVFSVATALALEYRHKKWVPPLAYSIAGLTAISRSYDNRHWTSDIVMGAVIGHFVTKTLYRIEEQKNRKKEPLTLKW
ncbi:MAG TPA: phosphatase PAP2 family protein [Flavihumibacter sp.]|jgi:hypothetical protein